MYEFFGGDAGTVMGGALVGLMLVVSLIIGLAIYVYLALAWMAIAKKLGFKYPWLAWIPIANLALIPILADKKWPWVFIFLIPIVNLVFWIIWTWKIFEKRKYPGWLSLLPIGEIIPFIGWLFSIAYLVIIGVVAWADRK